MQNKFENLMQTMIRNNEQLSLKKSKYNRAASVITSKKVIDEETLQTSLTEAGNIDLATGNKDEVKWSKDGITLIDNTTSNLNSNQVKFTGAGIFVTSNGNDVAPTWKPVLTANGLEASMILGRLDVNTITIWDSTQPRFMWNGEGLTAYGMDEETSLTQFNNFVRFNYEGLVFQRNNVVELSLGWNGLKIGAQGDSVQITANYGFQVFDSKGNERVQIGSLYENRIPSGKYGMQLRNTSGLRTLSTDSDGNLWLENVLQVGSLDDLDDSVGITSEENEDDSVRFWAGGNRSIAWGSSGAPKFIVTKSGDLYATNVVVAGNIVDGGGEALVDADLIAIGALTGTGYLHRTGSNTWALDPNIIVSATYGDILLGFDSSITGNECVMFGSRNNSTVLGPTIVIGNDDNIIGSPRSISIGFTNTIIGTDSIQLGEDLTSYGVNNLLIGHDNTAGIDFFNLAQNSIIIGYGITVPAVKDGNILLGAGYAIYSPYNVIIARGLTYNSGETAGYNVVLGYGQIIGDATQVIAIGKSSEVSGDYGIAIGASSNSVGAQGIAIGYGAQAYGTNSIAIGASAGAQDNGNYKLYIAHTNTLTPLIYGEFDNALLRIHNILQVKMANGQTTDPFSIMNSSNKVLAYIGTDGSVNSIVDIWGGM